MTYVFRVLLLALGCATLTSFAAETAAPQIRLAVAISVDQLRADYLVRFRPYFGEGGFKRLLEGGMDFQNCHYRNELPAWVAAFNAEGRVAAAHGKTWDRLREAALYDAVQGPDDAPGEYDGGGLGRTFPRKLDGGTKGVSPAFLSAFDNSPFNTEVLGAFVERAIREERLGRHEATDFLGIGFSQLDIVGHSYGPDSHEVMDSMLRLDQVLASLFACLDREVGAGRWVAVLTADHGVAPLPERVQAGRPGIPAGRVSFGAMDAAARQALDTAFGPLSAPEYWFKRDNLGYHLRPSAMAARKVSPEAVAQVLKASVLQTPWVAAAWTRAELLAEEPAGDSLLASVRRGYYAPRDCDVIFMLQPYFMAWGPTGTTHGSPYVYDTHVPQLWYGAGVPKGVRIERVGVEDIAPTMANLLGLTAPPKTQGRRLF